VTRLGVTPFLRNRVLSLIKRLPESAASSNGQEGREMNSALLSMTAVHTAVVIASLVIPVLSPAIALDLGIPPQFASFYGSVIFFATLAALLPAPRLVLRFGAMRASQMAVVLAAVGLAPLALSLIYLPGKICLLALSALLIGFAFGPTHPASSHLLVQHSPAHLRARVFSLKQVSVPIAGIVAGLLFPVLNDHFGWQATALATASFCILIAWAIQPLRERFDADRNPQVQIVPSNLLEPLKLVLSDGKLAGLALKSAGFASLQFTFTSMSVTFLVEAGGLPLSHAGQAFAVATAASILSRPLWGWAADRWRAQRVLGLVGLAMGGAAYAFAGLGPTMSSTTIFVVAAMVGASAMSWNGIYLAEIARIAAPSVVSSATSGAMLPTYAGALAGPLIYGVFATTTGGFRGGFVLLASIAIVTGLAFLIQDSRTRG
jgi:MFS family permease